jgi:nitrate/nitrite transport system ATP-binding protein
MWFLELDHVTKGYGGRNDRTEVLHDVTLSVAEGEFVAIVGYSGAGKTTLMNLVAGLATPDAGSVRVGGKPVKGPGPDRGVVFQSYSLLPWLTAYGNVHLAIDQIFPCWTPDEKRRAAERYLALVNLSAARDKRPAELSGGMRQRVAVARALAMNPRVLLLDEPFGALDALTRATLQDELGRIWRESEPRKTVLMITNDVDEALLLADRIVPLSAGPAATLGPAVEVTLPRPRDRKAVNHDARFKQPRNEVIEYLLGPGRRRASSVRHTATTAATAATCPAPAPAAIAATVAMSPAATAPPPVEPPSTALAAASATTVEVAA